MNNEPASLPEPSLPPEINLKMALDYLYARATELGLNETAHLIGTAAMLVEKESHSGR